MLASQKPFLPLIATFREQVWEVELYSNNIVNIAYEDIANFTSI